MNKSFSEITINGLKLKNRFVRAATWEGLVTPEGQVTQKLLDIEDGVADCIAMSRFLIREPNLVSRRQNKDLRPAECKSDNLCFTPGFEGKRVSCVTKEIEQNKKFHNLPTSQSKRAISFAGGKS